jgi:hypothetical protein
MGVEVFVEVQEGGEGLVELRLDVGADGFISRERTQRTQREEE